MIFVDANIFLELMLEDKRSKECKAFFEKLKNKEVEARTSDFIIYSCLLEIQHKIKSLRAMENFVLFINELKGLHISRPSIKEIFNALKIANKYNLDLDDSLVVSVMLYNKINTLISFDKHFDRISLIERKEP